MAELQRCAYCEVYFPATGNQACPTCLALGRAGESRGRADAMHYADRKRGSRLKAFGVVAAVVTLVAVPAATIHGVDVNEFWIMLWFVAAAVTFVAVVRYVIRPLLGFGVRTAGSVLGKAAYGSARLLGAEEKAARGIEKVAGFVGVVGAAAIVADAIGDSLSGGSGGGGELEGGEHCDVDQHILSDGLHGPHAGIDGTALAGQPWIQHGELQVLDSAGNSLGTIPMLTHPGDVVTMAVPPLVVPEGVAAPPAVIMVDGHWKTWPDDTPWNNLSFRGRA